jgi:hypothetical protein
MANAPKKKPEPERAPIPFNEALKRLWKSPPQHKTSKKPKQKKTGD